MKTWEKVWETNLRKNTKNNSQNVWCDVWYVFDPYKEVELQIIDKSNFQEDQARFDMVTVIKEIISFDIFLLFECSYSHAKIINFQLQYRSICLVKKLRRD